MKKLTKSVIKQIAIKRLSEKHYLLFAIRYLLSTICYLLFTTCYLYGAFKENIWTARTAAMGGAFSAVSDDVSSTIFNPAGLAQIERNEANFTYAQKFLNLPNVQTSNMNGLFGYTVPKIGAFGLGYLSSGVSDLYTEQSIILTYSAPLHILLGEKTVTVARRTKEFPILPIPIYAGLNIKYLSVGYNLDEKTKLRSGGDPVFKDGTSKGGVAVDIGFLVMPLEKLSAALSVKNLLTPDVGLKISETVPLELTLGGGYKFGDAGVFEDLKVSLDLSNRIPQGASPEFNWRFGVESWFSYHRYAARLGLNNTEIALGGGIIQSLGHVELQLDYSFTMPMHLSDNFGSHRLSLSTRF